MVLKTKRKKREFKAVRLQLSLNGQYSITIPEWAVKKVLCAEKGDRIGVDFQGNKLILEKENDRNKF